MLNSYSLCFAKIPGRVTHCKTSGTRQKARNRMTRTHCVATSSIVGKAFDQRACLSRHSSRRSWGGASQQINLEDPTMRLRLRIDKLISALLRSIVSSKGGGQITSRQIRFLSLIPSDRFGEIELTLDQGGWARRHIRSPAVQLSAARHRLGRKTEPQPERSRSS